MRIPNIRRMSGLTLLTKEEMALPWQKPAGIPLSLLEDRAGAPLQKNFSYIVFNLSQQSEQLLMSFIMESGYLK